MPHSSPEGSSACPTSLGVPLGVAVPSRRSRDTPCHHRSAGHHPTHVQAWDHMGCGCPQHLQGCSRTDGARPLCLGVQLPGVPIAAGDSIPLPSRRWLPAPGQSWCRKLCLPLLAAPHRSSPSSGPSSSLLPVVTVRSPLYSLQPVFFFFFLSSCLLQIHSFSFQAPQAAEL